MDGRQLGHIVTDSSLSSATIIENHNLLTPSEEYPSPMPSPIFTEDTLDLDQLKYSEQLKLMEEEHDKMLSGGRVTVKQRPTKDHTGIVSAHGIVNNDYRARDSSISHQSSESISRTLTVEIHPTFANTFMSRGGSVTALLKSPTAKSHRGRRTKSKTSRVDSVTSNVKSGGGGGGGGFDDATSLQTINLLVDEDEENKTVVMVGDAHTYDTFHDMPLLSIDDPTNDEFEQIRENSEYEYKDIRKPLPISMQRAHDKDDPNRSHISDKSATKIKKDTLHKTNGGEEKKSDEAEEKFKYDDLQSRMKQIQETNAFSNSANIRIEIPENAAGELLGNFLASQIGICVPSADVITSKDSNKAYRLLNEYGRGEEYKNVRHPPTILVFEELNGMSINTLQVSANTIQRERYLIRNVTRKIMGKKFPQKLGKHCKALLRDSGFIFALDIALCNPTRFPVDEPFEGVDAPG
ncbi:hypothetical protein RFI_25035 [Reticulomyxa filosa]|uniref:Uncharacterized protein n=1 Tax=Reticulomyxa filosa TaxID=46433 RepID=X6MFZ7_RETFI|nr:hypothetical protein RFI_25035 [Reticulomyxa filosa]|eukprot:ETO12342.1 hypothetical protein RFI_25035 [Reticulomyxa filosa]